MVQFVDWPPQLTDSFTPFSFFHYFILSVICGSRQHLFIEYQHCANQYAKCHSVSLVNFLHVDMTNLKYLCLAFTSIPESIQLKTCPVSRGSVSLYYMKEMREEELLNGDQSRFRMGKEDLRLLSKDIFSFALKLW